MEHKGWVFKDYKEVYDEHGVLIRKFSCVNGREEGDAEYYYKDGQLGRKVQYKKGKLHGDCEVYHQNGQLGANGVYYEGGKDGSWSYYYDSGQLKCKCQYEKARLQGLCEEYHTNGQLYKVGYYDDGFKDAVWRRYYENGQLASIARYEDRELVTEDYISFHENGSLSSRGYSDKQNNRHGYTYYDKEGKLYSKVSLNDYYKHMDGIYWELDSNMLIKKIQLWKEGVLMYEEEYFIEKHPEYGYRMIDVKTRKAKKKDED